MKYYEIFLLISPYLLLTAQPTRHRQFYDLETFNFVLQYLPELGQVYVYRLHWYWLSCKLNTETDGYKIL